MSKSANHGIMFDCFPVPYHEHEIQLFADVSGKPTDQACSTSIFPTVGQFCITETCGVVMEDQYHSCYKEIIKIQQPFCRKWLCMLDQSNVFLFNRD